MARPPRDIWWHDMDNMNPGHKCEGVVPSKFLRQSGEKASPRPILRREHADAGSAPDLIERIEDVHHVEAQRERLHVPALKLVRQSDIELGVRLLMTDVGVAAAQAAAVEHVGTEPGAVPEIG